MISAECKLFAKKYDGQLDRMRRRKSELFTRYVQNIIDEGKLGLY
jgi:hypothetical protein